MTIAAVEMQVGPDIARVTRRVDAARRMAAERDARMQEVYDVRSNRFSAVQPGSAPDAWPKAIVANSIDIAARQLAESLATFPSVNCSSGTMTSQRARDMAAKRTKIAYSYIEESQLRVKLPQGCDWYLSYGFLPIVIDADFESRRPVIRFDCPLRTYPQVDLYGRVVSYTKVWRETAAQLADKFPLYADAILGRRWDLRGAGSPDSLLECIKYADKDWYILYLPERNNLVLMSHRNTFGKVPVAIAFKPSFDDQTRGQYDDIPYMQLAHQRMALLGLQATQQTVRAPLAVPTDLQKIALGDDAVLRTSRPQDIRRVGTDMPVAAFQQEQMLAQEIQRATRTPASATGDVQASIITGRGVEALNSGYDIQVATGQTIVGQALQSALSLAFEMDEFYWPEHDKNIRGMVNGAPYDEMYRPSRDIRGNHQVQVSYGFASGLNPNQALIFLLQLRGDQQVSRDFVQRQLPMDIDVSQMQANIDIEQVQDALKQGIFSMLSSAGIMAQQGIDPTDVLRKAASIIEMREKGKPIHKAILETFAPPAPKQQPGAPAPGESPLGGPPSPGGPGGEGGGVPFGMNPGTGLPGGTAPGQAQLGPGGKPDVMTLLAGLTQSGKPSLQSAVKRSVPA